MQRVLFVDVLRLLAPLSDDQRAHPGRRPFRVRAHGGGLRDLSLRARPGVGSVPGRGGDQLHLTTLARFEHPHNRAAVRRRLRRAVEIVLVGYLLQARWPGVYFDTAYGERAFGFLVRCEVLQCIGFSLLALELVTLAAKNARQVHRIAGALASFLAPLGELYSQQGGPSPGACRGSRSRLPVSDFALGSRLNVAGVVLGQVALPRSGLTSLARRPGPVSAGLVVLALSRVSAHLWAFHWVRASSVPWFVLEKLVAHSSCSRGSLWQPTSCAAYRIHIPRRRDARHLRLPFADSVHGGSRLSGRLFARSLPWSGALSASLANLVLSVVFALPARLETATARPSRPRSAALGPVTG